MLAAGSSSVSGGWELPHGGHRWFHRAQQTHHWQKLSPQLMLVAFSVVMRKGKKFSTADACARVCERERQRDGGHTTHRWQAGGRERNSSAYTKVSDGGGARSPLKSMVRQAVPRNLWRTTVKQRSTCSLQRIHCSRGIFAGGSPWRAHAGAGSGRSRRENPTFKQTFW